jgi:hypothetical protein
MAAVNYRHVFHAGNFGDCMKHALLVWLLRALQRKPAPMFVLDTHAGADCYDLASGPAGRTEEWRKGIGRLLEDAPAVLADYVGLVALSAYIPARPRSSAPCCGETIAWPAANCTPRTRPRFAIGSPATARSRCIIATHGRRSARCCHRRSDAVSC